VLVVEDNEAVGQFSTDMLHDLGYKTVWASSAPEALDRLGDDAAGFDLIFTDVVMPGMNGVEFARIVQERFADLPVILTSGYSEVLAREEHSGFVLIQKPYSVEALSRTLQIVLAGKPGRSGSE
jgi:CheY-like chemotaxis protein